MTIEPDQIISSNLARLGEIAETMRRARWIIAAIAEVLDADGGPSGVVDLGIDGDVNVSLHGMTGADIVKVRRELAERGIRLRSGTDDRVVEMPSSNFQGHYLSAEGGGRVYLGIYLNAVGAKRCEYVKVGTKTVEQPIYEMRCTEVPADLAAVA
jgi:hypothetical protein